MEEIIKKIFDPKKAEENQKLAHTLWNGPEEILAEVLQKGLVAFDKLALKEATMAEVSGQIQQMLVLITGCYGIHFEATDIEFVPDLGWADATFTAKDGKFRMCEFSSEMQVEAYRAERYGLYCLLSAHELGHAADKRVYWPKRFAIAENPRAYPRAELAEFLHRIILEEMRAFHAEEHFLRMLKAKKNRFLCALRKVVEAVRNNASDQYNELMRRFAKSYFLPDPLTLDTLIECVWSHDKAAYVATILCRMAMLPAYEGQDAAFAALLWGDEAKLVAEINRHLANF